MPYLNGRTCPHENTFFVKLSENAHYVCAVNMHISDYRRAVHSKLPFFKQGWSKTSPLLGQISSLPALMQGVPVPKSWAKTIGCHPHYWWALSADSMPTNTTYAALKNCLMFASKSPLAYLCVCYCLSWSTLFRHFRNLPVNFKCAKIILTYICNIYSLVQHEIGRVDLLQNVNWYIVELCRDAKPFSN